MNSIVTMLFEKIIEKINVSFRGFFKYFADLHRYNLMNKHKNDHFMIGRGIFYPRFIDWSAQAGSQGAYFWQDYWASKHLYEEKPKDHYDIGSRVDGFIRDIVLFIPNVHLIDVRPLNLPISNLSFICADAKNLAGIEDNSVESLSSLCAIEHFGLGRYGDPIDPDACFEAFESIQRVVRPGGKIYISVPIGKEHLEFNAHRVFYATTVINAFSKCRLVEFSTVHNAGKNIIYNDNIHRYDRDNNPGGRRFGLFVFEKM